MTTKQRQQDSSGGVSTESSSGATRRASEARVTPFEHGGEDFLVISLPKDCGASVPDLTEAERAVAEAVLEGRSNVEIAALRGTSVRTVANQIAAIFRRLGVGSRAELVVRIGAPGLEQPR